MVIDVFLIAYLAMYAVVLVRMCRSGRWLDMVPSASWTGIIVLGFLVQKNSFKEGFVAVQGAAILTVALALFAGDIIGALRKPIAGSKVSDSPIFLKIGYALLVTSFVLQAWHLYLMPTVPLWALVKSFIQTGEPLSAHVIYELRESSSKLLRAPLYLIYAFQYSLGTLTPLALVIFLKFRRWGLYLLLLAVSLIYSRATLAKGPSYLLVITCFIHVFLYLGPGVQSRLFRMIGVVVAAVVVYAAYLNVTNPLSLLNYRGSAGKIIQEMESRAETGRLRAFTIPDYNRLLQSVNEPGHIPRPFEGSISYLLYRGFLVPAEVASRWYVYYPRLNGGYLGWSGLLPSSRLDPSFRPPSNVVGVWAYTFRFPYDYESTINAYASADADIYAHFGFWGVVFLAVILFSIRSLISWCSTDDYVGVVVKAFCLVFLGLLLPQASLQAILFAHGYVIMFGILVLYSVLVRIRRNKHEYSA